MKKIVKMLDALSDETRLRVFLLLTKGDLCVCELMNILNMKQARISHVLRILSEAGLTSSKRDGKWIIYSVNPESLKLGVIKGLLNDVKSSPIDLKRFRRCKGERIRETCMR